MQQIALKILTRGLGIYTSVDMNVQTVLEECIGQMRISKV